MGGRWHHRTPHHDYARPAIKPAVQPSRRATHRRVRFSLYHRIVAADGRSGLIIYSDLGNDDRDVVADVSYLFVDWLDSAAVFVTALSVGGIVCIASSNGGTTSQDLKTGFLIGSTPKYQQIAIVIGSLASALVLGPVLMKLNDSGMVYVPVAGNKDFTFASSFRANPADYEKDASGNPKREHLSGAQAGSDTTQYFVYHKTNTENGPAGRYLVDEVGTPVYLADPGIKWRLR